MKSSHHTCPYCYRAFTCTPPVDQPEVALCTADDCISYDPERDTELRWGYKEAPKVH